MVMLGINEGANSSVCVYDGGRIRFAVQEERVARKKEFIGFPHEALAFTLAHCGLTPKDIEAVCLSNLASPTVTRSAFLADYDDNLKSLGDLIGAGEGRAAAKRLFRRLPRRTDPFGCRLQLTRKSTCRIGDRLHEHAVLGVQ